MQMEVSEKTVEDLGQRMNQIKEKRVKFEADLETLEQEMELDPLQVTDDDVFAKMSVHIFGALGSFDDIETPTYVTIRVDPAECVAPSSRSHGTYTSPALEPAVDGDDDDDSAGQQDDVPAADAVTATSNDDAVAHPAVSAPASAPASASSSGSGEGTGEGSGSGEGEDAEVTMSLAAVAKRVRATTPRSLQSHAQRYCNGVCDVLLLRRALLTAADALHMEQEKGGVGQPTVHVQLWRRHTDNNDNDGNDNKNVIEDGGDGGNSTRDTLLAEVSMPIVLIQKGCLLQGKFAPFEEWFRLKSAAKSPAASISTAAASTSAAAATTTADGADDANKPTDSPSQVFVLRLKFELAIEAPYEAHEKRRTSIAALRQTVEYCRRQEQQITGVREQVRMLLLQRGAAGASAEGSVAAANGVAAQSRALTATGSGASGDKSTASGASVPQTTARAASARAKALSAETEASAEFGSAQAASEHTSLMGRLAAQWDAVVSAPHFDFAKNATIFGATVVAMHFFGHNMEI